MKTFHCYIFTLICFCLITNNIIYAQTCQGTLGDPIEEAGNDFGRGVNEFGPALAAGITTYMYIIGTPNDGQYSIAKTTRGMNSGWHQNVTNHTPNDPNGYMMVVNASHTQDTFFQGIVNNLCPNTTYEFSAWIINILRNSGFKPNVKFVIENTFNNTTTIIKEFSTGDIVEGSATDWKLYGTIMVTPANLGVITLKMMNINPGGNGNDLAIDDIAFRPCGPTVTTSASNNITAFCAGENRTINLNASISTGYSNPTYQWQRSLNNNWIDIPNENSLNLTTVFTNAVAGDYPYRLLVAEQGNIQSPNCRIASVPLVIKVNALPNPVAQSNGPVCVGKEIRLSVDAGSTFNWTGPNGFNSTLQNPIINNATLAMAGTYTVTVKNLAGCETIKTVNVNVLPQIIAGGSTGSTKICLGESLQLLANGGTSYSWFPTTGLSNPNIANPIARPTATTTYTCTISNGACEAQITLIVNVSQNAASNAGENKIILKGKSTTLNGTASGDNVQYHWQPSDYLDDPTKLNPVASPPSDMIYTLYVQSDCNVSTDEMEVKVLGKVLIPNTFSPNGDGINDTWDIPVLKVYTNSKVKVFNRGGQEVYSGNTASAFWDGKYKGKELPVGTYYYTIFLEEKAPPYSGWLLLTR